MAERKVVPFDEFYYQLKLMHLFQKHPVSIGYISQRLSVLMFLKVRKLVSKIWTCY
jgi:hypothetical protein